MKRPIASMMMVAILCGVAAWVLLDAPADDDHAPASRGSAVAATAKPGQVREDRDAVVLAPPAPAAAPVATASVAPPIEPAPAGPPHARPAATPEDALGEKL